MCVAVTVVICSCFGLKFVYIYIYTCKYMNILHMLQHITGADHCTASYTYYTYWYIYRDVYILYIYIYGRGPTSSWCPACRPVPPGIRGPCRSERGATSGVILVPRVFVCVVLPSLLTNWPITTTAAVPVLAPAGHPAPCDGRVPCWQQQLLMLLLRAAPSLSDRLTAVRCVSAVRSVAWQPS